MKLMIVTSHPPVGEAMKRALGVMIEMECLCVDHKQALETFLLEEPTHALVFEYEVWRGDEIGEGNETFKDLQASASPAQKIIRCGWTDVEEEDFVRMPVMLVDVIKALGIGE